MRLISIFILFLFLMKTSEAVDETTVDNSDSSEIEEEEEDSNLQLISRDFRILSRVINAIYLQAAALQQDIKVHQVLMELLQIDSAILTRYVMNVDVKQATSELNRIYEKSAENANSTAHLMRNLSAPDLMLTIGYLDFMKLLRTDDTIEIIEYSLKNASAAELFIKAAELKNDPIFNNSCAQLDDTLLQYLIDLFGPNRETHKLPSDLDISKLIEGLSELKYKVLNCIEQLENLSEDMAKLEIRKSNNDFRTRAAARKWSTRYVTLKKSQETVFEIMQTRLREWFAKISSVWITKGDDAEELSEMMERVFFSVKNIHAYNQDYTETDYIHTAGFSNSSDLIKIFDDLKSPFFLKKIAKGANITNLLKMFQPFRMVSEKIISLETAWIEFTEFAENKVDEKVLKSLEVIATLKKFGIDYTSEMDNINKTMGILETCQQTAYEEYITETFKAYEKQENVADSMLNRIRDIQGQIGELTDTLQVVEEDSDFKLTAKEILFA
uniref:WSN domain-containing protein n=1 Tax=Caenorhabditis tropicalis TaxID=1561998 RepID=A0A1I7SXN1_9PELO